MAPEEWMHRHVLVLSGLLLAALALPGGSALADDLSACTASAPTALNQRIASCSRAIASDRAPPDAYLARGQAFRMKADYGDAIEDFDAVIDMDAAPALTAEALLGRGAAFAARGKLRKAIADLGRALDIGLPPGRQAAAYYYRGLAHADAGNFDESVADFDAAIRLGFTSARAYGYRGSANAARGDYDLAIRD
ncbi:MAG: tetratricopeptide repeat protein, partial [Alphaproteobacteria bacterium]|nr:tetratricopeptide repeat protein [Alphaproteobacteria bacterium]